MKDNRPPTPKFTPEAITEGGPRPDTKFVCRANDTVNDPLDTSGHYVKTDREKDGLTVWEWQTKEK